MKLTIENLSKQYCRDFFGLKDFSLELTPGIIGLLGPNGAGKSTLMRILATINQPTSGTVKWNGTDIVKSPDTLRATLGYLPQDFGVYPNLNAVEFLEYMAAIKGIAPQPARQRIDELLQLLNLAGAARRPLGGYSGGMKQRVGIAQALLNDPQLLIVDEPTVGLDPEERVRFRNLLSDLAGERIIILSTHIVSDVDADILRELCDRFRQYHQSGVVVLGSVSEGRPIIICAVTDDLVKKGVHAGEIAKRAALFIDGSGGGRPNLAQAGGKDASKLDEALALVPNLVHEALK